ncbi:epigen isoform X2 [Latimeria chalumnae]|uniref:epigen isoform X2 n=1 Tax=Latimeria chalumnae TaxID=7897 RepID=UPI0003C161C9|nr:PREDICTED: epigen isoform X2 [Latimeria chalumnae]|eukprot:XP_006009401.1 PREDICTED: epigen isoform X2 [Latimeria chalumnae]
MALKHAVGFFLVLNAASLGMEGAVPASTPANNFVQSKGISLTTESPSINSTQEYLEMPVVLQLKSPCVEEHENYCLNGICTFHKELRKPTCRCHPRYDGERCEHMALTIYTPSVSEKYIAIGVGLGLLISGTITILYCCVQKRCKKSNSPYKVCSSEVTV